MAAITAELALEVSKFQGSLRKAQESLRGFRSRAQRQGDRLGDSLFSGVGRAAAKLGGILAAGLSAYGIGKAVSSAIGRAVQAEQLQVSFDVLVGDASKAKETIASLRKLGAETPFEFPELAEAGKKLIAFGEGADSVTGTLRRIGDISSGIQAPISQIAEIYGKARVQGRLFAEDINQLTGRGIPVIQEFAKQLGVADAEVKQMASAGNLTFANLEQAFISLTAEGGKFGGMMARQSRTVGGLWSTFKDTVGEVLLSFGQPINDALRPLLDEANEKAGALKAAAARVGAAVAGALKTMVAFFQEFSAAEMGKLILDSMVLAFKTSVNVLFRSLVGVFAATGRLILESFKIAVTLLSIITTANFWKGMAHALIGVAKSFGAILLEFLAKAVGGLQKIPGLGRLFRGATVWLQGKAEAARESASESFARSKGHFRPALDAVQDQFAETVENVGRTFSDTYDATGNVFDTSKQEAALGEASARLRARIAASEARARRIQEEAEGAEQEGGQPPSPATAPASPETAETPDGKLPASGPATPAPAPAPKTVAPKLAPGAFASAINLVMGRSANELILDETKKQTTAQRQMADQLKEINDKLTPKTPPPAPAAPVPMPVDTTPRFA